MTPESVQLIECPRDAMQGWPVLIPTAKKTAYINRLLSVGFHSIDFGSFVSAKAIPQMADSREVLNGLDISRTHTRLLAIVANPRGAAEAAGFENIQVLGYPFSVSETFQQLNTNRSVSASFEVIKEILEICSAKQKELVIYLSMAFGNPYGDPYESEIVVQWAEKISALGITVISLADTVGLATPELVGQVCQNVINALPGLTIGAHLHATFENCHEKIDAAYQAGCRRFDGALKGIGGCPMSGNPLVGNMDTESLIAYFLEKGIPLNLNETALAEAIHLANEIFLP
jgi:hydroxymethylglutaryl-CoA lyase